MGEEKPRLVLDTNVLVSALGWPGVERRLLRACMVGRFQLCMSAALLAELIRVLDYPKFVFPVEDRRDFLEEILRIAYFPPSLPEIDVIKEDPPDNNVLACAVGSEATAIITGDSHLLRLGSFREIPILGASMFLTPDFQ